MNRRWVCNDVWMDMFPFFDHAQLGLKLALLSPRFEVLVDKHFDSKTELTLWRPIEIRRKKEECVTAAAAPEFYLFSDVAIAVPDRPLSNKSRFKCLQISYIDHSVIAFLRANQQIWDKGTNLCLDVGHYKKIIKDSIAQPIWNVFVREILPIFAPSIRHLKLRYLLHISPTILSDLNINSIGSVYLPNAIDGHFDDPNANSAGQFLSEWLHTPTTDGQPKRLFGYASETIGWLNSFKEKFLRATTSVSYKIQFIVYAYAPPTSIVPFECVNERTSEKLTLTKTSDKRWILKRCQIGETAVIQWEHKISVDLSNVHFLLEDVRSCIGPLSPSTEEAGQSVEKEASSDNE